MAYKKHWSQKHFGNRSSQKAEQLCAPDAALETGEGGRGQPQPAKAGQEPERYVMTPHAAKILNLSPRTLEPMRVEGTGPRFFKAGGGVRSRVLYKVSDLYAWLESISFTSTSQY